jgi:hypothetical protein
MARLLRSHGYDLQIIRLPMYKMPASSILSCSIVTSLNID